MFLHVRTVLRSCRSGTFTPKSVECNPDLCDAPVGAPWQRRWTGWKGWKGWTFCGALIFTPHRDCIAASFCITTQNGILIVVSQCSIALSVCQCSSVSISVNGCQVKFVSKEGSCKEGKSLTSGRHGSRQAAITWANGPIQSVIQSLKVVHFHSAILMCTTDQHLCSVAFFNYSCTCNAPYCTTLHHILWSSSQHVCSHNLIAYVCFLCFAFKHFWEQWKDHWTLIQWLHSSKRVVFLVLHHCGPNEWAEYYETILWLFNIAMENHNFNRYIIYKWVIFHSKRLCK